MSEAYNRLAWALRFRSGDQWDEDQYKSREQAKRPTYVVNITDAYCNRIVSPVKKHPLGMEVTAREENLTATLQSRLREIEHQSQASGVYAQAYDNAVTGGRGFWVITKDFRGKGFDQDIFLVFIQDPTNVITDPASICPAGEDAEWGAWVKYTDEDKAVELYGEDVKGGEFTLYENFRPPADTVCDMVFYVKKYKRKTIYQLENGEVTEEKPEEYISKRETEEPYICVHHFIGDLEIEEDYTELNCSYIPIVPVYGQTFYRADRRIDYRGIAQILEDIQKGRNFFYSNELEQASTAPKVKWLLANGQEEGHDIYWDNANTTNFPYLPYNQVDVEGRPAPVPQRIDSNANLGPMIEAQRSLDDVAGRVTGIMDPMLGGMMGNESGFSRAMAIREGELSTQQFLNNLQLSIAQSARIICDMLIRDLGVQDYRFRDEEGQVERMEMDFGELGIDLEDVDFSTSAGPMYANERQTALMALESFGAKDPEANVIMRPEIMRLQDFEGAKGLADKFEKQLAQTHPHLVEQEADAPDPEAMQALESMQIAMEEQEQALMGEIEQRNLIITQLQNALQARDQDNETKIIVEQMKQEGENQRNTQDNLTDIAEAQIKQGQEVNKEEIKQQGELARAVVEKELEQPSIEVAVVEGPIEPKLTSPVQGGSEYVQPTED